MRKLVVTGKSGHPLLSLVASHFNEPLIVYTTTKEDATEDARLPASSIDFYRIGLEQDGMFSLPIDINVWLNLTVGIFDGKSLSNNDLIAEIGNTIGAHLDPHLPNSVQSLSASYISTLNGRKMLTEYVLGVSYAVHHLCKQVAILIKANRESQASCD